MNLLDFQRDYYDARTEYDVAKAESDRLEKLWRAQESKLIEKMMGDGVKSVTLSDGSRPTLAKGVSVKCNKDTHDQVRAWLLETVGDDSDFVETLPNRHKVAAHVKKEIEEKGMDPDDFPDFLAVSVKPTMRVLGWTKRLSSPPKYQG
tara:strand:- start:11347 stop:11790 length:444 start_codon:yes stop_codon:yes gene_type:complete